MITLLSAFLLAATTTVPTPAVLEAGLVGRWQGNLSYRDYQTDKLQEIPVTTRIEAMGDGVTTLRVSTFDDGPKTGDVIITTASLFDPTAGTVTSASLRKGRTAELSTARTSVTSFTDETHWKILNEEDGEDNDKPALIRITEERDGDLLTETKEVQPKGGKGDWQFRNRTNLVRQGVK
jgi:hypothetical protein